MREFESSNGRTLIVKHKKSAVILETHLHKNEKPKFQFEFSKDDFRELAEYLESVANEIWTNFNPKDATSEASDYWEYYDKEFDNNGYLSIGENSIYVEGPHTTTGRLYQFNKAKMQSFIYDLRKRVTNLINS